MLVTAFLRAVSFKRIRWVVLDLDSCVLLFFLAIAEYGSLRVVGVVVAGPLLGFMLTAGVFGTGFLVLFFLNAAALASDIVVLITLGRMSIGPFL